MQVDMVVLIMGRNFPLHLAFCSVRTEVSIPEVQQLQCEADHSPSYRGEIKNAGAVPLLPLYTFNVRCWAQVQLYHTLYNNRSQETQILGVLYVVISHCQLALFPVPV
jgi:hypothetical protein